MLFTYIFNERLDLAGFRKQAAHYMGKMNEINYHLYLPHYKIMVESAMVANSTAHIATVSLLDIKQNKDGEIVSELAIFPLFDFRFKESEDIQAIFSVKDNYRGSFTSNSTQDTVEKICRVMNLVHKIDKLKAFL